MNILKNFKIILPVILLITFVTPKVKAADECFEGVSRSIFKFNMGFDKAVLRPLANVIAVTNHWTVIVHRFD